MKVEYLPWDSEFFGKRVARLTISEEEVSSVVSYMEHLREEGNFDVVYIVSARKLPLIEQVQGCTFVDEKIVFAGDIVLPDTHFSHVMRYVGKVLTPALEHLAWVSAGHSRFKVDQHFGDNYKRLYSRWIENSLNGTFADDVLVHEIDGKIDGVLTLRKYADYGDIGLLAVDTDVQTRGVGTSLVGYAQQLLWNEGIKFLRVTTQGANQQACRFYTKQGLQIESITYIYHYWL